MLLALTLHALLLQASSAADPTLPPPSAQLRYTAQGRGVQVYQCIAQGGSYAWVLQGPEAVLLDPATRQHLGTHTTGPTWTWDDGSSLTGEVLHMQPAPGVSSIPWLLLKTQPAGHTVGALTSITLVRRSETQAGVAPATGCDAKAAAETTTVRVPYVAIYSFYSSAP